jgi:hypothetical protein
VGPAGNPSKHPYQAYYFAGKDNSNSPEACATCPNTISTVWCRLWEFDFVSVHLKKSEMVHTRATNPGGNNPPPEVGGTSNNNNVAALEAQIAENV